MTADPSTQALKRATGRLVAAVGGQEACPGFTRVRRHQSFSDYANAKRPEFMTIDVVRDLEAVTQDMPGAPHVTRELARQAGFALVPLPGAKPEDRSWAQHLACVATETNDVISGLATAIADGKICGDERRKLIREADEAVQKIIDLRATLEAVAEDSS